MIVHACFIDNITVVSKRRALGEKSGDVGENISASVYHTDASKGMVQALLTVIQPFKLMWCY